MQSLITWIVRKLLRLYIRFSLWLFFLGHFWLLSRACIRKRVKNGFMELRVWVFFLRIICSKKLCIIRIYFIRIWYLNHLLGCFLWLLVSSRAWRCCFILDLLLGSWSFLHCLTFPCMLDIIFFDYSLWIKWEESSPFIMLSNNGYQHRSFNWT